MTPFAVTTLSAISHSKNIEDMRSALHGMTKAALDTVPHGKLAAQLGPLLRSSIDGQQKPRPQEQDSPNDLGAATNV